MANVPLQMTRDTLEAIPDYPLPGGYSFQWYRPGDGEIWVDLHVAAENYVKITPALFHEQFHDDDAALRERMCFLCKDDGQPIGTATAWYDDLDDRPEWGRVHWVAIVPEMQGKGLAKPLLSAILWRLRDLGHRHAYLTTSSQRVPALNLYLSFGFMPSVKSDEQLVAWRELAGKLRPRLRPVVAAACPGS